MLSIIVIAKNEQERIKVCLESVKWADELIVIDSGSVDDTAKIAKQYTDKVYSIQFESFAKLRNEAFLTSKGDWVLYIDSDERVLSNLRTEITTIINSKNSKSAYALSRINVIFGQNVSYGPYKNDWIIRLFKRSDFENWVGDVHEHAIFKGDLGYTKNSLIHLTHRDIDHFVRKSLEWSLIDANLRFQANHPLMTKWRFIRILITESFNQLILRRGFFGGTVGIIDSVLQVFFFYMTYVRLWQLQQSKPLPDVYKNIDEELVKNDFKYL